VALVLVATDISQAERRQDMTEPVLLTPPSRYANLSREDLERRLRTAEMERAAFKVRLTTVEEVLKDFRLAFRTLKQLAEEVDDQD
jgi:hypothetical protein